MYVFIFLEVGYVVYDGVCMMCLEQVNFWRWKVDEWLFGFEGREGWGVMVNG